MSHFTYKRNVHFYETDAMGVVHHSNHLRYFEEARGAWFRARGMDKVTWDKGYGFPVVSVRVEYSKPARFDDDVEVRLQLRVEGVRIHFQYQLVREDLVLATGSTVHVPIDENFKVCKLPPEFLKQLEKEPWTETWL